jgi:hypothetical protein
MAEITVNAFYSTTDGKRSHTTPIKAHSRFSLKHRALTKSRPANMKLVLVKWKNTVLYHEKSGWNTAEVKKLPFPM